MTRNTNLKLLTRKAICILLFVFGATSAGFAVDCLDAFQADMVAAGDHHQALLAAASSSWHIAEADAIYNYEVANAANAYDDCCQTQGGPGCP